MVSCSSDTSGLKIDYLTENVYAFRTVFASLVVHSHEIYAIGETMIFWRY